MSDVIETIDTQKRPPCSALHTVSHLFDDVLWLRGRSPHYRPIHENKNLLSGAPSTSLSEASGDLSMLRDWLRPDALKPAKQSWTIHLIRRGANVERQAFGPESEDFRRKSLR